MIMTNTKELKDYLKAKIAELCDEKRQKHVEPAMALESDFFNAVDADIRKCMNELFHERQIKVHKSVNCKLIEINEQ